MKERIQVCVKGKQLKCSVCDCSEFFKLESYLNTRISSFLIRHFEVMPTTNYICSECGYVFWFTELPHISEEEIFREVQPLDENERSLAQNGECPNCFTKVEDGDVECSFCGFVLRG